jgi:ferritin-like metal-binding protein YciE
MAEITTPRELFLHELGDILYVEEKLAQEVLPKLINEVQHDEFRTALENHLEETRGHIENVEQVFSTLGESPKAEQCVGFEGLKQEKEELTGKVSEMLVDSVNAGAAARTEHYEIAAYEGLITMARALGEREAVDLLEQNLKDDKETARQIESLAKQLSKEQVSA